MNTFLHFLLGTWFVCHSDFPMWTKGNKTNPTFNYRLIARQNDSEILFDEVRYLKNGKSHSIKGYDHPDKKDSSAFVWRGKGILSPLKSRWKVVLNDQAGKWAVIYFSKTLFTPEGVDIICREPKMDEGILLEIKSLIEKDSILKKHVGSLKQISH